MGSKLSTPKNLKAHTHKKPGRKPELVIRLAFEIGDHRVVRVKDLMRDVWMQGAKPGKVVGLKNGDWMDCSLQNLYYTDKAEVNRRRTQSNRKVVVARDVCTGEVLDVYSSVRLAAKKNFVTASGMGNRINRKTVVDGVIFEFER